MNKSEAITLIEELKDFLRDIGCGDQYGILGHDAGGVIGNQILYNMNCYELDGNGNRLQCRVMGRDKSDIEGIQEDMYEIIDKGRDNKFIQKLEKLLKLIKQI